MASHCTPAFRLVKAIFRRFLACMQSLHTINHLYEKTL